LVFTRPLALGIYLFLFNLFPLLAPLFGRSPYILVCPITFFPSCRIRFSCASIIFFQLSFRSRIRLQPGCPPFESATPTLTVTNLPPLLSFRLRSPLGRALSSVPRRLSQRSDYRVLTFPLSPPSLTRLLASCPSPNWTVLSLFFSFMPHSLGS